MGTLYIVATPIGNLEDISIRCVKTLFKVDAIACEDTRRTGTLLKLLKEKFSGLFYPELEQKPERTHLISYYEQNESSRIPEIINGLINGLDIALVSDAGTPSISDPGFKLIRECLKEKIKIEIIPGPSAVISALVVSGLPTDKFFFAGFPPRKPGHRISFFKNILQSQKNLSATVVLFESPHKLINTLSDMQSIFGDIAIVTCRELTKIHEENRRELISEALIHFQKTPPKGEFVLLFHL